MAFLACGWPRTIPAVATQDRGQTGTPPPDNQYVHFLLGKFIMLLLFLLDFITSSFSLYIGHFMADFMVQKSHCDVFHTLKFDTQK